MRIAVRPPRKATPALMSGCEAARHLNRWLKGDSRDLVGLQPQHAGAGVSHRPGFRIAQVFYRFPVWDISWDQAAHRTTADCSDFPGEMGYGDTPTGDRLLLQRN